MYLYFSKLNVVYNKRKLEKAQNLNENNGKSGIYMLNNKIKR